MPLKYNKPKNAFSSSIWIWCWKKASAFKYFLFISSFVCNTIIFSISSVNNKDQASSGVVTFFASPLPVGTYVRRKRRPRDSGAFFDYLKLFFPLIIECGRPADLFVGVSNSWLSLFSCSLVQSKSKSSSAFSDPEICSWTSSWSDSPSEASSYTRWDCSKKKISNILCSFVCHTLKKIF